MCVCVCVYLYHHRAHVPAHSTKGEPKGVLGALAAIMALLVVIFMLIVAVEVGKEDSTTASQHAFYDRCIVTELTGKAYWIRLSVYLGAGALAGAIVLFVWIWRGRKVQNYELAMEGGSMYHALEK